MRNRNVGLFATVVLALFIAGCGKAGSISGPTIGVEESLPALPPGIAIKVSADKVRPTPKPAIGVMVDGRWYPKGQAPTVAATPAPEAPKAGLGHLHLNVTLANRSTSFVDHLVLTVTAKDATEAAFTQTFAKDALVGSKLSATATNLAPGAYDIKVQAVGKQGGVVTRDAAEATVEADKTAEAKI